MKQKLSLLGFLLLLLLHNVPLYAQYDEGIDDMSGEGFEFEELNDEFLAEFEDDFVDEESQLGGGEDTSFYSTLDAPNSEDVVSVPTAAPPVELSEEDYTFDDEEKTISEIEVVDPNEFKLYRQGKLVKVLSDNPPVQEVVDNWIDDEYESLDAVPVEIETEETEPVAEPVTEETELLPLEDATHASGGSMIMNLNSTVVLGGIALAVGVLFGIVMLKKGRGMKSSSGMEMNEMPISYSDPESDKHERLQNALEEMRKES